MTPRSPRLALLAALLLLALHAPAADAPPPFRFVVMADPHLHLAEPGNPAAGYRSWPNTCWPHLPRTLKNLDARRFFVVGDILSHKLGPGATIEGAWDAWDAYIDGFRGVARVEWSTGAHETLNDLPREHNRRVFAARYPHRFRQRIVDGDHAFILLPEEAVTGRDPGVLPWLEKALRDSAHARHIWFFEHIPPLRSCDWWPPPGAKPDPKHKTAQRIAALLEKHKVTAAFFGHLHHEAFLGDPGGFPLFLTGMVCPLLVEVHGERVSYRWLKRPLADDPLERAVDAIPTISPRARIVGDGRPLAWQAVRIPRGDTLPEDPASLAPTESGTPAPLDLRSRGGRLDLDAVPGLAHGDHVLLRAAWPVAPKAKSAWLLLATDLPLTLWIDGVRQCRLPPTRGRTYSFRLKPREDGTRLTVLLSVEGPGRALTLRRHNYAQDLPGPAP
jgi:hypothetical protein